MEKGVFDALQRGYLARVQFEILDRHPADAGAVLLESYDFNVSHVGPGSGDEAEVRLNVKTAGAGRAAPPAAAIVPTNASAPTPSREDVHASVQRMIKSLVVAADGRARPAPARPPHLHDHCVQRERATRL